MKTLPILILATLLWGAAEAGEPSAELDRARIAEGETVTLTISVPGDLESEPTLAPLQADFDILNRSVSSQTTISNGRVNSRRVWQLMLAPKRRGELRIPAIQVGSQRTRPLALEVGPPGSTEASGESPPVLVEVEASPESPYVQAQMLYRVRILSRVGLQQAVLSGPRADGALLERLGEDRSYRTVRNGHRYDVVERRYALFPQRSGPLRVEGPVLSAAIPVENGRRRGLTQRFFDRDPFAAFPDMGSLFQETRPVRVRGKTLEFDVRPHPPGLHGDWLPARSLSLSETWSPEPAELRVGEPVTRTLTLSARGLTDSQLPEPTMPVVRGLKLYPDRPQGTTGPDGDDLVARKETKFALVPTRPGVVVLPEIRVDWWDLDAQRARTAVLAARELQVLPAATAGTAAPASGVVAPPPPSTAAAPPASTEPPPSSPVSVREPWPWIAALMGLAWLGTLVLWMRDRRGRGRATQPPSTPAPPGPVSTRELGAAFRAAGARAARQALLSWAATRWPDAPPRGLTAIARRLDDPRADAVLTELEGHLYGPAPNEWDAASAWEILRPVLYKPSPAPRRRRDAALPDLFPETG